MKFISLFLSLILSTSINAKVVDFNNLKSYNKSVGLGGDLVGNGSGISEKNILFSYVNLESYIKVCIKSPTCKLTNWEKSVLNNILINLPQEQATKEQIQFLSEKDNPGIFLIDGDLKIAKTGNNIGSKIYINLDLLYTKNSYGDFKAFGISDAVALLIHEMGHHHGVKNQSKLDLLGIKVSMSLENHSDKASLFPHKNDFMAISINQRNAYQFPQLLIYFGDTFMDISQEFKKALKCPGPFFYITKDKPNGANFHNMYWKKLSRLMEQYEFTISGNVSTYCQNEIYNPTQLKATTVEIKFKLQLVDTKLEHRWKYLKNSLKIKHFQKRWWRALKLPDTH